MLRHKTKQYIHLLLFFGLMCMLSACGKKETVQNQPEIAGQSSVQDDVQEPASVTDDNDTAQEPQNPENDTTQPPDGQADDKKDRDDRKDKDNGDSQQADTSVDDVQQENTQKNRKKLLPKKDMQAQPYICAQKRPGNPKTLRCCQKGALFMKGHRRTDGAMSKTRQVKRGMCIRNI